IVFAQRRLGLFNRTYGDTTQVAMEVVERPEIVIDGKPVGAIVTLPRVQVFRQELISVGEIGCGRNDEYQRSNRLLRSNEEDDLFCGSARLNLKGINP